MSGCEVPSSPHDWKRKEEETDLVDKLLEKSGCADQHYAVSECMFDHQDWRKCQKPLKELQACMLKSQRPKPI